MREELAGRYYQLLSGHPTIGPYLHKIKKIDMGGCWWCSSDERQLCHHLFVRCKSWTSQREKMWRDIGKACRWKHPRDP